jgi:gamma-glutamyltranspeptidase
MGNSLIKTESQFSDRHMVSAGHHLAADAAREILDAGGNAADAGVCGGICLTVLLSEYVNFAGRENISSTMKLGFTDRHAYYGDPRFIEVPIKTLPSPEYARTRAAVIDAEKA